MEKIPPTTDHFLIRHATKVAIGILTGIMVLAGVIFWKQNEARDEARGWVSHTYEVIGHVELLYGKIKDAVIGQRGFILTGNDVFLEPYQQALKDGSTFGTGERALQQHRSIHQELTFLRTLSSDNPVQQSNLDEMDETVKKLLEYLAATIQERRKHADVKLDLLRGKATMDQIRSLVRIMEAEETHLLSLRMEVADNNAQQSNRLTLIAMVVFYVIITLAIWLYQHSREQARVQLVRYTQELEQQQEELKQQQEELKASNEEIEAANEEMEEKSKAWRSRTRRFNSKQKN